MVSINSNPLLKRLASKTAVGITVDEDGIRFVRFNPKQDTVEQAGLLELDSVMDEDGVPDISGCLEQVKLWIDKHGLSGSRAHLAAPTSQSFIRLIQIPKVKRKQLRRVTDLEVESSIRLPFEDPIIDYHWFEDAGETSDTIPAFVAAVPSPIIVEMVSALEQAGLNIISVDLETIALMRIIQHLELLNKDNVMVLNFKPKEAEVYLYNRGIPDFVRSFPLEPMTEDGLASWRYGEIVSSVSRIMNFYENTLHEGTEQVQDIMITGNAPDKALILDRLAESYNHLNLSKVDLSVYFGDNEPANRDSYAVALGLAMKGAGKR